ncbi:MAG: hypothetical protein V1808_01300 [Candidatus Daviesbacteria bacterium]
MSPETLIVPKLSKLTYDMQKYHINLDHAIRKYQREGIDPEKVLASNNRQVESLNNLTDFLKDAKVIGRNRLNKTIAAGANLIIALGGDNHFLYVSHFINGQLLLGINSDPTSSEGALTYFTVKSLKDFWSKLEADDFKIEEWPRLQIALNGKKIQALATGDIFIGESRRENMSRYLISLDGQEEEQKSSGLLITTGAGSTGWYDSACHYLFENGNKFPKTKQEARYLVTEVYRGKLSKYQMLEGGFGPGQKLIISSLNDSSGEISIDSLVRCKFNRGSQAIIEISDKPLRVISLN